MIQLNPILSKFLQKIERTKIKLDCAISLGWFLGKNCFYSTFESSHRLTQTDNRLCNCPHSILAFTSRGTSSFRSRTWLLRPQVKMKRWEETRVRAPSTRRLHVTRRGDNKAAKGRHAWWGRLTALGSLKGGARNHAPVIFMAVSGATSGIRPLTIYVIFSWTLILMALIDSNRRRVCMPTVSHSLNFYSREGQAASLGNFPTHRHADTNKFEKNTHKYHINC